MKQKQIVKLLVGVIVIGGGLGYFMYQAIQSSSSYYYSVDEFSQNSEAIANHSLRIAGIVKDGTVTRDLEKTSVSFILAGTDSEISVTYNDVIPDNFTDGVEVVVEGRLATDGTFQANNLMTRCESKYKAKVN